MVSTTRRGWKMRSQPLGSKSTWRRRASRMRRLMRLRWVASAVRESVASAAQ
jgi:hypothetical protein